MVSAKSYGYSIFLNDTININHPANILLSVLGPNLITEKQTLVNHYNIDITLNTTIRRIRTVNLVDKNLDFLEPPERW